MRAAIIDPRAGTLELQSVPDPEPGPRDLLVHVRAAGLNRADLAMRRGEYRVGARPAAPPEPRVGGGELAGEVVAIGPAVTRWKPGDRVMAMGAGYAELARVDERLALPVPESFRWEEAGTTPVALLTAHDALVTNGRLREGETVLVHAVSSGVGVAALQLARHLRARLVFGTSRVPAKLERLRALGLDVGIDTTRDALAEVVHARTDGRGVDVVVDNVGAGLLGATIEAAAILGRIVQVGRLGGRRDEIDLDELARKRLSLVGVTFRTRTPEERIAVVERFLAHLGPALAAGAFRPLVDRVFELADVDAAQRALAENRHVGKLALLPAAGLDGRGPDTAASALSGAAGRARARR
jgi:NADPH:quinone reductase-like Zn-dependent oxidoreductase